MCKVITWCLVVGAFSFCLGCGKDNPQGRCTVEGTVTLNGEPLEEGSILFIPTRQGPVMTGAVITEGEFEIPEEKSLTPGEYGVKIDAVDKTAVVPTEGVEDRHRRRPPPMMKSLIPPEWTTGRTHKVTIKEGERNEFTFDIVK